MATLCGEASVLSILVWRQETFTEAGSGTDAGDRGVSALRRLLQNDALFFLIQREDAISDSKKVIDQHDPLDPESFRHLVAINRP